MGVASNEGCQVSGSVPYFACHQGCMMGIRARVNSDSTPAHPPQSCYCNGTPAVVPAQTMPNKSQTIVCSSDFLHFASLCVLNPNRAMTLWASTWESVSPSTSAFSPANSPFAHCIWLSGKRPYGNIRYIIHTHTQYLNNYLRKQRREDCFKKYREAKYKYKVRLPHGTAACILQKYSLVPSQQLSILKAASWKSAATQWAANEETFRLHNTQFIYSFMVRYSLKKEAVLKYAHKLTFIYHPFRCPLNQERTSCRVGETIGKTPSILSRVPARHFKQMHFFSLYIAFPVQMLRKHRLKTN